MAWRPHGRAHVDPSSPRAFGCCDRCGFLYNFRDLTEQMQWAGSLKVSQNILVCDTCLDEASPFLRTLVLPADPPPIIDARVEPYALDEDDFRVTQDGVQRITQYSDELYVHELSYQTPSNIPASIDASQTGITGDSTQFTADET